MRLVCRNGYNMEDVVIRSSHEASVTPPPVTNFYPDPDNIFIWILLRSGLFCDNCFLNSYFESVSFPKQKNWKSLKNMFVPSNINLQPLRYLITRLEMFVQGLQTQVKHDILLPDYTYAHSFCITWYSVPASFYSKCWVNITVPCTKFWSLIIKVH